MQTPERTQWAVIAAAVFGGVVAAFHVGKVPPALSLIRDDLGISLVSAGFVVSVFNLLGMILALPAGAAADRLGRGRLATAGFLCLALGSAMGAFTEGLTALLFSRFIEGVGLIGIIVALPAVVMSAASGRDRSVALSLWSVFMPLGMAIALLAAPYILQVVGWRGFWLVTAGLALVALVLVQAGLRRVVLPPPPPGHPLGIAGAVLMRPGMLFLSMSFGAYAFQWVSLMVWLPTFLAADLGAEPAWAAVLTAIVVVINVPGNILSGWLQRRGISPRVLIALGSLAMGGAAVGIFQNALPNEVRFALCLAFSFGGGLIPSSLFSSAPQHAPTMGHMGAANGMLMQGSALGQFIGPPLLAAAVLVGGGSWSAALVPLLIGAVVTLAAGWAAFRCLPRHEPRAG